ncbi:hypothetical protein [Streptomyces sp. NPDC055140]
MRVTRSGFVLEGPDILEGLRQTADQCSNPAHRRFVDTAITAFEEDGPDAEPLLNDCPPRVARLIFDEVAEAYVTVRQAARAEANGTSITRELDRPYTRHRRERACKAARDRRLRNATGLDRLRCRLTMG